MRLERRQIDLDYLVKIIFRISIHLRISCKVCLYFISRIGNICAASGSQVAIHRLVVTKGRGRSPYLCTHVTDGTLSCTRHRNGSLTEILDNGARSSFYG